MEVKGVPCKKRYFCNLILDNEPYKRTFSKTMTRMCFWGEYFELKSLPQIYSIRIDLLREGDKRPGHKKIGSVEIELPSASSCPTKLVDEWHPLKTDKQERGTPSLRIKHRFQSLDILPLPRYNALRLYLRDNATSLCQFLEPMVCVKAKEDIATALVHIMQAESMAVPFLVNLILSDIQRIENEHLLLRGNSIATKAIEAYMRLVGESYLREILSEPIQALISATEDLEVDPLRIASVTSLPTHREALKNWANRFWERIVHSGSMLPVELREIFHALRKHLSTPEKSEVTDNLISACVFLRFLCPAILYPSLFNITQEYPEERTVRNLTLIAKALQTLANFTSFRGKENYMEFLNVFIDKEQDRCRNYLRTISNYPCEDERNVEFVGQINIGRHCALLHLHLSDAISRTNTQANQNEASKVVSLVDGISIFLGNDRKRKQPIPCQISSHTPIAATQLCNQSYLNSPSHVNNNYMEEYDGRYLENSIANEFIEREVDVSFHTPTNAASRSPSYPHSEILVYEPEKPHGNKGFNYFSGEKTAANNLSTNDDYVLVAALNHHNDMRSFPNQLVSRTTAYPSRSHSVSGVPSPLERRVVYQDEMLGNFNQLDSCSQQISALVMESENIRGSQTSISQISNIASSGYQSFAYSPSSSPVDSIIQTDNASYLSQENGNLAPNVMRHNAQGSPLASPLHQVSGLSKKQRPITKQPAYMRYAGHVSLHATPRHVARQPQRKISLRNCNLGSSQSVEDLSSMHYGGGCGGARRRNCSSSSDSSPDSRPAPGAKSHLQFAALAPPRLQPRTNPLCSPHLGNSPAVSRRGLHARNRQEPARRSGRRKQRSTTKEDMYNASFEEVPPRASIGSWRVDSKQISLEDHQALTASQPILAHQETQMKAIAQKLSVLEQEFRHEQDIMWQEMHRKDARIDDQAKKIAELDNANCKLSRTVAKLNNL